MDLLRKFYFNLIQSIKFSLCENYSFIRKRFCFCFTVVASFSPSHRPAPDHDAMCLFTIHTHFADFSLYAFLFVYERQTPCASLHLLKFFENSSSFFLPCCTHFHQIPFFFNNKEVKNSLKKEKKISQKLYLILCL